MLIFFFFFGGENALFVWVLLHRTNVSLKEWKDGKVKQDLYPCTLPSRSGCGTCLNSY